MGKISSIHFERSKRHNTAHNDRTLKPSYQRNNDYQFSLSSDDALALYKKLLTDATYNYTLRTGQKPQFREENLKWSAVVNIKSETTMDDLKKLAEHFEKKYGWQCYQYAIHKDEGEPLFEDDEKKIPKLDKDGKQIFKPNLHAHLEFLMLNKQGITCFKKKDFGIKKMKEIQTEVADILCMQRGQENSQAKRLTHQQFKQEQRRIESETLTLKQENKRLKSEILTLKEQKAQIEEQRNKYKKEGDHIAEEYRKLQALNKERFTQEDLTAALHKLQKEYEERISKITSDFEVKLQEQSKTPLLADRAKIIESATEEELQEHSSVYQELKHRFDWFVSAVKGVSHRLFSFFNENLIEDEVREDGSVDEIGIEINLDAVEKHAEKSFEDQQATIDLLYDEKHELEETLKRSQGVGSQSQHRSFHM